MRAIAVAVAAAIAAASPALAEEQASYGKTQGAIPGILVGPKLNVIALPPGLGLEAKLLGNQMGLAFDYGFIPTQTIDKASVSWTDWSLAARWYPWAARFYVGAAYGSRNFSVSAKDDKTGQEAKASVSSNYIAPELGWKFVWDSGLFLGIDLGYQIVLGHSATFTIPGGVDPSKEKDVRDASDTVGKTGLPILTLLQVGYFF
jgi:hypothetical protein